MLCCAALRCAALCCVLLCCSVLCCAVPVPVPVTGILKSAVFFSRDVVVKLYEIDNMLACVCVYVCVSAFARAVFLLVQKHQQLRFMYGVTCYNNDLPLLLLAVNC